MNQSMSTEFVKLHDRTYRQYQVFSTASVKKPAKFGLGRRDSHACLGSPPPRIVIACPGEGRGAAWREHVDRVPNLGCGSVAGRRFTLPGAERRPAGFRRWSPAATARRATCAPELAPAEAGGDDHGLAGGAASVGGSHPVPLCQRAVLFETSE